LGEGVSGAAGTGFSERVTGASDGWERGTLASEGMVARRGDTCAASWVLMAYVKAAGAAGDGIAVSKERSWVSVLVGWGIVIVVWTFVQLFFGVT